MISNTLKVKDRPGLIRDVNSKAIISVDDATRQNYINQKNIATQAFKATNDLKTELDSLKSELNDVKSLLKHIVEKLDK